jgi:hypothetical protein
MSLVRIRLFRRARLWPKNRLFLLLWVDDGAMAHVEKERESFSSLHTDVHGSCVGKRISV